MKNERTLDLELLDLGPEHYTQTEYEECLTQLARIGRYLGGDKASLKTLKTLEPPHSILDVGCGGGHFTMALGGHFSEAQILGVDISTQAIAFANSTLAQTALKNVKFEVSVTPELSFLPDSFDVVISTLVCHHLSDVSLIEFMRRAYQVAKKYVIINDLHRHPLAYRGFDLISSLFFRNRLIRHDGLLSIKRSFIKQEWIDYLTAAQIPLRKCSIRWHWPFRWILCIESSAK